MLPAINRSVGMNLGFPDVCMTPAGLAVIPVPYPNIGLHAMSIGFSPNVMLSSIPALSLASMIPITTADEAGVAHPTIKGMATFMTGSPIVFVNMLPGIHLTCVSTGNNMNDALAAVIAPGITNVFYTYSGLMEGADPEGDLAPLDRAEGPSVELLRFEEGVMEVRVRVMSADVPARVFALVRGRGEGSIRRMVLDLRDNPGGALSAFVALAGDFLPEGAEIAALVDEEGDEVVYRGSNDTPYSFEVEIVVNSRTASAAELFAKCLAAHGRAEVRGGPTYGKTTASRVRLGAGGKVFVAPSGRVVLPGSEERRHAAAGE